MAELIAHLGEVEERRLHLAAACSSMFAYCLRLGMTEDEAYRRIEVARLARRYPAIFPLLAEGQLTISAVALLKHHLSEANHLDLLGAVAGKTVVQTRELIDARFPRPDVASSVRKLSERPGDRSTMRSTVGHDTRTRDTAEPATRTLDAAPLGAAEADGTQPAIPTADVQGEYRDALTRPATSHIPRSTRRIVVERDGLGCSWVDERGVRGGSRSRLEDDHRRPPGKGGGSEPDNLRLLCRNHNRFAAEREHGQKHVERTSAMRRRERAPHAI